MFKRIAFASIIMSSSFVARAADPSFSDEVWTAAILNSLMADDDEEMPVAEVNPKKRKSENDDIDNVDARRAKLIDTRSEPSVESALPQQRFAHYVPPVPNYYQAYPQGPYQNLYGLPLSTNITINFTTNINYLPAPYRAAPYQKPEAPLWEPTAYYPSAHKAGDAKEEITIGACKSPVMETLIAAAFMHEGIEFVDVKKCQLKITDENAMLDFIEAHEPERDGSTSEPANRRKSIKKWFSTYPARYAKFDEFQVNVKKNKVKLFNELSEKVFGYLKEQGHDPKFPKQ